MLARRSEHAREQLRYYTAAASARDPALARATLELIGNDKVPDWVKPGHAEALVAFTRAHASAAAQQAAKTAYEAIMADAELKERLLPSVQVWISRTPWLH